MENLREEHSLDVYLRAFEYLTIWAVVHPKQFAEIVERLHSYIGRIKAQLEKDRQVELNRIAAVALEKYCDTVVDQGVADLARDAFARYGSREDPRYMLLIPQNPTEAMRNVGGVAQANFVANILVRIAEDPEYQYLQARAAQLRTAQEALDAATAQKNERFREEKLNAANRDALKAQAAEEYRFFHPELVLKFRDDPHRVELFFLTLRKAAAAKEPTE